MTTEAPYRDIYNEVPRPVVFLTTRYPPGHRIPLHRHHRAQLAYAAAGVMTMTTERGSWVVPPLRAVWVPAGSAHAVETRSGITMRSAYVDAARVADLPAAPCVIAVTPLLRELIIAATEMSPLYDENGPEGRIVAVLLDQIRTIEVEPLHLPEPADARLRRVTEGLRRDPGDRRTVDAWARDCGTSGRTLTRLFRQQTGMSFGAWRTQLRLHEALQLLAEGQSVTAIALDLGYESVSTFISTFRRALGVTPGGYFRKRGDRPVSTDRR